MRCTVLILTGLAAASAVPVAFFPREFLGPDPVYAAPAEEPFPYENYEVPPGQAFHFALQLPKLDLSQIFKPLRVFAGVNTPAVVQQIKEEQRDCDVGKFDLTEEESDVISDCQQQESELEDKTLLKQCILDGLPETSLELRAYLDREEFSLVALSSSYSLALVDGNFNQKRTMSLRLCPKDELNSIDAEEELESPHQTDNRIEMLGSGPVVAPVPVVPVGAVAPMPPMTPGGPAAAPGRPLLQFGFPQLQLPNFEELFAPLFSLAPGSEEGSGEKSEEESEEESESAGPGGFLTDLFSLFQPAAPPNVDLSDCTNEKFDVSRPVYEIANECKHADEYRECLRDSLEEDEEAAAFLEFAADPDHEIVGSTFTQSIATTDDEVITKNSIYLNRCRLIEEGAEGSASESKEENYSSESLGEPASEEETEAASEELLEASSDEEEDPADEDSLATSSDEDHSAEENPQATSSDEGEHPAEEDPMATSSDEDHSAEEDPLATSSDEGEQPAGEDYVNKDVPEEEIPSVPELPYEEAPAGSGSAGEVAAERDGDPALPEPETAAEDAEDVSSPDMGDDVDGFP